MKKLNLNTEIILPILPVPVFLLSKGIVRLRIFEPRYLKMVKIATKGTGFVIWGNSTESPLPNIHWGSWVEIINFNHGKDNILEIDVKCKALVGLNGFNRDQDDLLFAKITPIHHWSEKPNKFITDENSSLLAKAIEDDILLNELYCDKQMNDINWVIARWLELLPISMEIKSTFVFTGKLNDAKNFVESIILN
ncbi:MAG: hypothetical protein KC484_00535 [Colwelliaceae bacterium]|jgi:Lon protease-like protein|nr:hypothetical protein [Colwelliaceae bacterium]